MSHNNASIHILVVAALRDDGRDKRGCESGVSLYPGIPPPFTQTRLAPCSQTLTRVSSCALNAKMLNDLIKQANAVPLVSRLRRAGP